MNLAITARTTDDPTERRQMPSDLATRPEGKTAPRDISAKLGVCPAQKNASKLGVRIFLAGERVLWPTLQHYDFMPDAQTVTGVYSQDLYDRLPKDFRACLKQRHQPGAP